MSTASQTRITHDGRLFRVEIVTRPSRTGGTVEREIVRHPGAVLAVPVLDDGRLVLIRNYRDAVDRHLLEMPAGKLEPEESPGTAVVRELEEETGYRPSDVQPLGTFYTSPGMSDERMHVFLASGLTEVGQQLQDDEQIEVSIHPADEVEQMVEQGVIQDGKTIAALLLWKRQSQAS